jgi:hypothetical protein
VNKCQQHAAELRRGATGSRRLAKGLVLTMAAMIALALGASVAPAQNPIPVINAPLVPGVKAPGAAKFSLTVNGTGFVSGAVVNWNGNARTTTFVSGTQVTASITAADVAKAGTFLVTVSNPAPGGGVSNIARFQVVKTGYTTAFSKLDYATDLTPQDVATADFNGDGQLDLAVATGNNSVSILLGNGTGAFPAHVEYPVPGHPAAIVTGDFNGDGKADLATADQYLSEITVLLGNGDGTFQAHQEYATGTEAVALATADVNGDGTLDIIVADLKENKVSVLLGNGDGTFQANVDYATGSAPSAVAIGDFNGDGKLDLIVPNNDDNTVSILLGNGDGSFQGPTAFPTAIAPNSVVIGDFNGDGKLDLAVGTSNKQVSILLGNGDGTFQNHKEYAIGANGVIAAAADLNSDGKLDLISANYNDNTVSTLIGNGDGTFKSESVFPTNGGPSAVAIGDFNDNGKLDIAVAATTGNAISVLTDSWIILSPNVLTFGTQTSGFPSAAKTVTLKNNGTTAYPWGTISTVGSFAADFTQTHTCGATVAAGTSCAFSIVFDPTASENANSQMLLTASNGSVLGAQMTGNGNIPITLAPRTMSFAYQLLGTTSKPKTDTFTNDSGVPLTFTKIDLEGVNQNDFGFTSTCPLSPATLAPGASCTSSVTYHPSITGGETTTQVYYGSFTLAKQGLLISGQGTAVNVTPTAVTFPATAVGTSSSAKTVTFKNAGSSALPISSVTFAGTAPYFSQTNTCQPSVPANSSCTFSVVFTPQATGTFNATMSIGDPDPTGPQKISLTGTGQ